MNLQIVNLGYLDYPEALQIQQNLFLMRTQGKIGDVLLLVEHPPVLTLGVRGKYDNILLSRNRLAERGVKIYEVKRGGDVTYHGPGQIVGYPIMNLANHSKGAKEYVWKIEEVFIRLLKEEYGLSADREEKKYTGVWIGNKKITAIGIYISRWITMHGFAFNVNTDLSHFNWINPCGITDKGVTSIQQLTGQKQDLEEVFQKVAAYFCKVFAMEGLECTKESLLGLK
jgi:lipoate-protein ligase B